jgi:transcriptional regulator with XRE-family HTH domain
VLTATATRTLHSAAMLLGRKIEHLLIDRDMSMRELARRIGRSSATVSRYVAGTRQAPVDDARAIAAIFGVSLDWLADPETTFPPPAATDLGIRPVDPDTLDEGRPPRRRGAG